MRISSLDVTAGGSLKKTVITSMIIRALVIRSAIKYLFSWILTNQLKRAAVYWLDFHRVIAIFSDLLGVRRVVCRGRFVMGLVLFLPRIQFSIDSRS